MHCPIQATSSARLPLTWLFSWPGGVMVTGGCGGLKEFVIVAHLEEQIILSS